MRETLLWRVDAEPIWRFGEDLVPRCLFFCLIWSFGSGRVDDGLWRFGSPLYSLCLHGEQQYASESRHGLSGPHCYTLIVLKPSNHPRPTDLCSDFLQVNALQPHKLASPGEKPILESKMEYGE